MKLPTPYKLATPVTVSGIKYATLTISSYQNNSNTALILTDPLLTPDMDPFEVDDHVVVSVNLHPLPEDLFHLDVNKNWAVEGGMDLAVAGIITATGDVTPSGFVEYPVYRINYDKL